MSRKSNRSKKK